MIWSLFFIVFGIAVAAGGPLYPVSASGPRTLGWAEHVLVLPEMLELKAKLDTGAETTSIDASQITRFEQSGRPWVRFSIRNRHGSAAVLERPVIRTVKVKRSDLDGLNRPVVMLALCLGGVFREESVTLSNRSKLRYPLLIGRSAMRGRFMVDSARKYTSDQDCIPRR
jgi:hypothetical protein